ncbi:MAG: RagB/SusD family nutrient uptake outer membrane protein [Mucilaginibacter sp.]
MKNLIILLIFGTILLNCSCKKLVNIGPPTSQLTPDKVFNNATSVNAATANIYTILGTVDAQFIPYIGVYTDELTTNKIDATTVQFTNSSLISTNTNVLNIWKTLYSTIYKANALIEGIQSSTNITDSIKNQCLGEAKFIRAYSHFMLVNIFGDVPLVTSTNAAINAIAARTSSAAVYTQIINDLKDANTLLVANYPASGDKVRANKWAACSLLSKVYLYIGDYTNAESQASLVINSGMYSLLNNLNGVFLANSNETILQNWNTNGYVNFSFIPSSGQPSYPLSSSLLNAFESGDNRKSMWTKFTLVSGTAYYYPYKYKQRVITTGANAEYVVYLRLADVYLIRAEARAQLNNLSGALADLNGIRSRAGLSATAANNQTAALTAIAHERQVELFTEGGNRFFDLKRSSNINSILMPLKPLWKSTASVFPLPQSEIFTDPNLAQNQGYNN